MDIDFHITSSLARFKSLTDTWQGVIACDTETFGKVWDKEQRRLLGISFSHEKGNIYVPLNTYTNGIWAAASDPDLVQHLRTWMPRQTMVGHNFTYDKGFIECCLGSSTTWIADTRIMWHMASAPSGPRPYGLKDAQTQLLGWPERGDQALDTNVKAKGGSLKNGDHYLADMPILAKYACMDTYSTYILYKRLAPFFDTHSYWPLLSDIMAYNELLEKNTTQGIGVDVEMLSRAHKRLIRAKEAAASRFRKEMGHELSELEKDWADRRIAQYKREHNKAYYAAHPEKWKKFNLNSDADKRELFYDKLRYPVVYTTDSGKPAVDGDSLKRMPHPAMESYLKYEKANTLSSNFSGPYLNSVSGGRLHPGFNICGTVSYRLSGFKPYLLNAPFDEKSIMRALRCDEGYTGIHADLAAIEPTITAHYSEDASLLKVFRDGLGDIYLDLALELFPNDKELQNGYNPYVPISPAVKAAFSKQRKVAKVIQLAVQYTGTGKTVARNLTKDGIPTTESMANDYVGAYWRKFRKVAEFNYRLKETNRAQGHLRNVIGRIVRVPDPDYKDLSNRFIQSSAHDVLILWVLEIYRLAQEQGLVLEPLLLDCHDSTSNQTPTCNVESVKEIYQDALKAVNERLALCVTIKAEIKVFQTLAGLKGEE